MYHSVEHGTLPLTGEWFAAQHEKAGSGTFSSALIGDHLISTADPGDIKAILATEFNNFENGTPDRILRSDGALFDCAMTRILRS